MHLPKYVIHKLIKMTKSLYIKKEFSDVFLIEHSQIRHHR